MSHFIGPVLISSALQFIFLKMPSTFQDVAASFSEDEWKLLHEWQKEVYRNVMKEIHQVFVSLGPLIASSVFSIRTKEKEDGCCLDLEDFQGRHSINQFTNWHIEQDLEANVLNNHSDEVGNSVIDTQTVLTFSIKQEGNTADIEQEETNRRESRKISSAVPRVPPVPSVFLLGCNKIKEEESFQEEPKSEFIPGYVNITTDDTLLLKEEECAYPRGQPESEKRDCLHALTSDEKMNREGATFMKYHEKTTAYKPSFGKVEEKVCQTSDIETLSKIHLGSHCNQQKQEMKNAQYESGFIHLADSSLFKRTPSQVQSYKPSEFQMDEKKQLSVCQQNTQNPKRRFKCTVCEKTFIYMRDRIIHEKTHNGEKPYQCPKCEKRFRNRKYFMKHQRTHMGDSVKPYQCNDCGKSFSEKGQLINHERTHTGEKPYKCNQCGKSFSQKGHLIIHDRTHTGEKPYQCTECDKSFKQRGDLTIHKRKHTGEKPHRCNDCGKSFSEKGQLINHERTHTGGEKPYKCNQCGKSFSQKGHLIVHDRTHTGEKPY